MAEQVKVTYICRVCNTLREYLEVTAPASKDPKHTEMRKEVRYIHPDECFRCGQEKKEEEERKVREKFAEANKQPVKKQVVWVAPGPGVPRPSPETDT